MFSHVLARGSIFLWTLAHYKTRVRFTDRVAAGEILGEIINDELKKTRLLKDGVGDQQNILVLGIPRGGVITALAVANRLRAKFNTIISRRLVAPYNKEVTIGAVMDSGEYYLNEEIIEALNISQEYVEIEKMRQMRETESVGSISILAETTRFNELVRGKLVVLIDDGAASGATLLNAILHIRRYQPKYIVVGVPVAPYQTVILFKREADKVFCVFEPRNESFTSVEDYYADFSHVTEVQVLEAISRKNPNR